MKKICILLCLVLCISTLTGCFSLSPTTSSDSNDETESEVSSETVALSDTEILSKSGHPKYLDDLSVAETFWKDEMNSGKIDEIGIWDSVYSDDILLSFACYNDEDTDSEYIGQVRFYFDHCDEKIPLNNALDIIESYLPESTINQYYNETESYLKRDDEYGNINYWKYYEYYDLNDENATRPDRVLNHFCVSLWTDLEGNATEASIGVVLVTEYTEGVTENWDYKFFS